MPTPRKDPDKVKRRNPVEQIELPSGGYRGKAAVSLPKTYRTRVWDNEQQEHVDNVIEYLPETRAWFDVWAKSPQATRFTKTAWQRLLLIARLVDRFNRGDSEVMAEIRLNESKLGATPEDLQRLHWRVVDMPGAGRSAPAADGTETQKRRRSRSSTKDPRLRLVK